MKLSTYPATYAVTTCYAELTPSTYCATHHILRQLTTLIDTEVQRAAANVFADGVLLQHKWVVHYHNRLQAKKRCMVQRLTHMMQDNACLAIFC
jgi:hypothetical protein